VVINVPFKVIRKNSKISIRWLMKKFGLQVVNILLFLITVGINRNNRVILTTNNSLQLLGFMKLELAAKTSRFVVSLRATQKLSKCR